VQKQFSEASLLVIKKGAVGKLRLVIFFGLNVFADSAPTKERHIMGYLPANLWNACLGLWMVVMGL